MEGRRGRLNPFARPFYPSTVYHRHFITPLHHRPRDEAVVVPGRPLQHPHPMKSTFLRYSSITPVPTGPRNRLDGRKKAPVGSGGDNNINNGCRMRRLKKVQETMPLDPNDKSTTSVMIRNIPNNYTRRLLVEFLEEHCKIENEKEGNTTTTTARSAFDFVYLPVDFKHRLNAGYAFVNFTTSEAAWNFHKSVTGKPWKLFQSKKIADVTRAKIQGKEAMTRNFERMKLSSPSQEYLPVCFEPPRDGCVKSPSSTMHTIGDVLPS